MQKHIKADKDFVTIMVKMVGTACNMNCEYCYEHMESHSYKKAAFVSAEEVTAYLSDFTEYKHILILFHGGEPFLAEISEVEKCLNYIKTNFKNQCSIQFQTNGTLLTDSWVELLKQYEPQLSLSVSLDPVGERDLRRGKGFPYRKIVNRNLKNYAHQIHNIGIVSVAHRFNYGYFETFIEELIRLGVKSLTINKYRTDNLSEFLYITEQEYVNLIKTIAVKWIRNKWYRKINIQPIQALLLNNNRLCIYLADPEKCSYFKTFWGKNEISGYCDHIMTENIPNLPDSCITCDIYPFCGGGCLMEKKDDTFCEARKDLYRFVEEVRNGNQKSHNQ